MVAPLFVADMDTLKARMRLSGASAQDALAIIDQAVLDVRTRICDSDRGLGLALVQEILLTPHDETTLTALGLRRLQASSLELAWVRLLLLRRMPLLFMDGSGVVRESWNEEPLTRAGPTQLDKEIARLEQEVQDLLGTLQGSDDDVGISAGLWESDAEPTYPGDSIGTLNFGT